MYRFGRPDQRKEAGEPRRAKRAPGHLTTKDKLMQRKKSKVEKFTIAALMRLATCAALAATTYVAWLVVEWGVPVMSSDLALSGKLMRVGLGLSIVALMVVAVSIMISWDHQLWTEKDFPEGHDDEEK